MPRVKTPTLLVTDIITMATSIAFVVTFICFVFHKAWIYHSIASETFFYFFINPLRTVPFIAPVNLLYHFLFFGEKVKITVEAIKFSTSF